MTAPRRNQGLSERRVNRAKRFLVEQGVPADNIETKAFGKQQNLTDAEVKDAVERNPELSAADREKVLKNMRAIILASNRRVDITLTNAGQAVQESLAGGVKELQRGWFQDPSVARHARPVARTHGCLGKR